MRRPPTSTLFPYTTLFRSILKSPPHTCRVPTLLRLFPDARFVHIVRDPYAVYPSTLHLWRILAGDRKSTRLNSSHGYISYAVFCLKKKNRDTWNSTP